MFKLSPHWSIKLLLPPDLDKMDGEEIVTYYNLLVDYMTDLNSYMFERKDL